VVSSKDENINVSELFETVEPEDLIKFGLIPELIGRLPVIATLAELDEEALINILTEPKNALVKQYQALFAMEGVELEILPLGLAQYCQAGDGAQNRRARPALDCGTQPARTMYQLPDLKDVKKVVINEQVIERGVAPKLLKADGSLYQAGETETKAVKKAAKRPAA
jgi:ATP-dependent Clp protease ATP-binding subunit ClpX